MPGRLVVLKVRPWLRFLEGAEDRLECDRVKPVRFLDKLELERIGEDVV